MNNKEDINELLARYFANEPLTVAQRRELDEWMTAHKQEFEQMRKVMNASLKRRMRWSLMQRRPGRKSNLIWRSV